MAYLKDNAELRDELQTKVSTTEEQASPPTLVCAWLPITNPPKDARGKSYCACFRLETVQGEKTTYGVM